MYPRSFLYEEANIKQRTPLKKKLCEIGEEAIWESRFTSFLFSCKIYFFTAQARKTYFFTLARKKRHLGNSW